jgi:hypothetical protein
MQLSEHKSPSPEAFRVFIEGVQNLQDYLRTNAGESLVDAEKQLTKSLAVDPDFAPAQYYKAIVLTHARKADDAIDLLEGLAQDDSPFKAEVLYNLAFAYARKYEYDPCKKSLALLDEAYKYAHYYEFLGAPRIAKRLDLVMLIKAMQAWTMAVFGGRDLKHPDDFEQRRIKYLPEAEKLAQSVLEDRRLKKLAPDTRIAVKVEAFNVLGIVNMRMGQYSEQFEQDAYQYWQLSEQYYREALELHSRDVRVLDNISTLNLIRASYAYRHEEPDEMIDYATQAKDTEEKAISFNLHDRFRWLNLARCYALLGEWGKAATATKEIPQKPGVPMGEEVKALYNVISQRDVNPIVNSYFPVEEKSSS